MEEPENQDAAGSGTHRNSKTLAVLENPLTWKNKETKLLYEIWFRGEACKPEKALVQQNHKRVKMKKGDTEKESPSEPYGASWFLGSKGGTGGGGGAR